MHHHRRLLAAQWQCSSTLFRWRPPPLLERRPPFADECSPRVGGRRANLLPVERRQCRPKPETGLPPNLLLRLLSKFLESGHESAVSHRSGETVTTHWSSVSGSALGGVTLHIYRFFDP
jgi:hypothetical protein